MSNDDLTERLRRLGLRVGRDALATFLAHVHKSRVGPTETLEQLADLEERARVAVNLARRTRFACLGSFKTLDRFDWTHPEKIDRALIERLVELEFVDGGENVLLKGGSGLGKTLIAQNLAQAALAAGFTVRFSTLAAALADLLNQESMPAFERRLRRYTSPDVLVLDSCAVPGYVERRLDLRRRRHHITAHNWRAHRDSSHWRMLRSFRQAATAGATRPTGRAFATAARFVSRSTAAYLFVVSTLACPSQCPIVTRSTPA